jgi:hypothetical protein
MAGTRDEFNARLANNAKKAEIEFKKLSARAAKIGRARKTAIANMIKQRASSFEALAGPAVNVPSAERYLVTAPFHITGVNLNLSSSRIAPLDSFARFKHTNVGGRLGGSHYWGEVVFRFVWENNTDKYVVINANGYIVLHGFCWVWSDGGVFPGARSAGLSLRPTLQLFDWTREPYPSYGKDEVVAFELKVSPDTTLDDAERQTKDVFRGYDLGLSLILVPPKTAVGLVKTAGKLRPIFSPAIIWSLVRPC